MALKTLRRVKKQKPDKVSKEKGLIRIAYLGDTCYLALDDEWARKAPDAFIVYTLEETEVLRGTDEWTKRMVHEAKRYGAKVIGKESRRPGQLVGDVDGNKGKEKPESPEKLGQPAESLPPDYPCSVCSSRNWWQRQGEWLCRRCHPKPTDEPPEWF